MSLFTNGAGIHYDQIGFFEVIGLFVTHFVTKEVNDTIAVVIVHLAAKAAQIEFFRLHGLDPVTMLLKGLA